jgi:hypothetical protein
VNFTFTFKRLGREMQQYGDSAKQFVVVIRDGDVTVTLSTFTAAHCGNQVNDHGKFNISVFEQWTI